MLEVSHIHKKYARKIILEDISFNAGGDIPLTKVVVDEKYVEEHLSSVIAGQSVKKYIL